MTTRNHFNYGTEKDLSTGFFPVEKQAQINGLGVCKVVSPMVGDSFGYADPSPVGSPQWLQEHEDLERLRLCVLKNQWPEWFLEKYNTPVRLSPLLVKYGPNILATNQFYQYGVHTVSEASPGSCAEVVKMDYPTDAWDKIVRPYMKDEGIGLRVGIAKHRGVPFVEELAVTVHAHALILKALHKAFKMKYYFGQGRPSEVNQAGRDIEQYNCPNHPEKPAGHGAFAGATAKAFNLYTNATEEQKAAVYDMCMQVAMLRSFAGVHLPSSNLLGFQVGFDEKITDFFGNKILGL